MLAQFFQTTAIPADYLGGTYDLRLVALSYIVATMASYIALDITGRLRDVGNTKITSTMWLLGGACAMGAGIWSMHFIGMLAFHLLMPMAYDPMWTGLSMIVAILASGFALFILKSKTLKRIHFALGGIILGFAIATMHYTGMEALSISLNIHYQPGLFFLSIVIAIVASEAAVWLALVSNQGTLKTRFRLKIMSAFIMGIAICGMHYTGMASAIFTSKDIPVFHLLSAMNPNTLAPLIAGATFLIMGIAIIVSTYKEALNQQALTIARQAGMAEVAINVLHNVGNVLNSLNISASLVSDKITHSKLAGLTEMSKIIDEHKNDLGDFLTIDSKGSTFPDYLRMLANYYQDEKSAITKEMVSLTNNIQHIKDIIATQQSLSVFSSFEQVVSVSSLLDEALMIANLDNNRRGIVVEKKYDTLKPILTDKTKLMQIFINILSNAKDSLTESTNSNKLLVLTLHAKNSQKILIQISDNGVGIAPENKIKIFSHGFTTKKEGHGFGLHSSALSATELGGAITLTSEGLEKGVVFTIELPYKVQQLFSSTEAHSEEVV